ncbi:MAG: RtcB family protein [Candidatus Acidiferrales bacterium]|jgi:tRNA-splicing ligase RtcB (3'-phosphate/5'-hydroxy nucleic acid ligase)
MNRQSLTRRSDFEWWIEPTGYMRVPGIIYAGEQLIEDMDEKVREQLTNVATLPGIRRAAYAMPDAHWGYGFPIGGVAAFDPDEGGVISAGGVGFDISCGVRTLHTGLTADQLEPRKVELADVLFSRVPAGVGSTGAIHLSEEEMDEMLRGGANWAIVRGYGRPEDLERIEEAGCASGAKPECVSHQAKKRQAREMGTLGSGNHYLEIQRVAEVFDSATAAVFGLRLNDIVVSIHCGSRGLGHQVGTDYLKAMVIDGYRPIPDRELACASINSELGQHYVGAMRAATNCALANRQIITHLVRGAFSAVVPDAKLALLYDVSHNTCKIERHVINGESRELFVHRKGATRAFGPGHPDLPPSLREVGQPVLIGGTMGTESHVMVGTGESEDLAFSSACHGAGRSMSRTQAAKNWQGRKLIDELYEKGVLIRTRSFRGVAEEAPGAYKDVNAVAEAAEHAKLARRVVRLVPLICVKG